MVMVIEICRGSPLKEGGWYYLYNINIIHKLYASYCTHTAPYQRLYGALYGISTLSAPGVDTPVALIRDVSHWAWQNLGPYQNKTVGFGQRPRPLHSRCARTGTCIRWEMAVTYIYCSRCKYATASLPKRLRNGRSASETAT